MSERLSGNRPGLILVVGVCASGKTTVVNRLIERGFRAKSIAQEHSSAPRMWTRLQPAFLVVLDCSFKTVLKRRKVTWGPERLQRQRKVLSHARRHCDLYLHTDNLSVDEVVERIIGSYQEKFSPGQGLIS